MFWYKDGGVTVQTWQLTKLVTIKYLKFPTTVPKQTTYCPSQGT